MLAFVMMMSPMSISRMSVAAASEASAVVAYLLTLWKMMAMGLVWAYVMFSRYTFFCARDCAVMSQWDANMVWSIVGTVPMRMHVSGSMRSVRYSSLTDALICWMTVCSIRLQRLNSRTSLSYWWMAF